MLIELHHTLPIGIEELHHILPIGIEELYHTLPIGIEELYHTLPIGIEEVKEFIRVVVYKGNESKEYVQTRIRLFISSKIHELGHKVSDLPYCIYIKDEKFRRKKFRRTFPNFGGKISGGEKFQRNKFQRVFSPKFLAAEIFGIVTFSN